MYTTPLMMRKAKKMTSYCGHDFSFATGPPIMTGESSQLTQYLNLEKKMLHAKC
jgi:hypothetical protein